LTKDIAIYGAGGLGRELALMICQINKQSPQWNLIGFFDDNRRSTEVVDDWGVLGGLSEANNYPAPLAIAIGISDPHVRFQLVDKLISRQLNFPTLIHPSCNAGDEKRNLMGRGVILTANVILTTGIKIDDFVIVNLSTTIGHDVTIGSCSSIMPGCNLSGNVKIGKRCQVGTGAQFLQNLSIGEDSIVGAGAVVTKSFPAHSKLIGMPAHNFAK
jgi:sugar O-acyltransferase (sialic acid O-acetyltransferase NeuD family)